MPPKDRSPKPKPATPPKETTPRVVSLHARCPICNKPAAADVTPFCSKRCADVDLGRWLGEAYRIPTDDPMDMDPNGDEG